MKRIIYLLLSIVLAFTFCFPSYAEGQSAGTGEKISLFDTFESVKLGEEEKATYAASESDTVIKIFARCVLGLVTGKESLLSELEKDYYIPSVGGVDETLLQQDPTLFPVTYYASVPSSASEEVTYTLAPVDAPQQPKSFTNRADWRELLPYAEDPSQIFGKDVEVYRVCCISEEFDLAPYLYGFQMRGGAYIYFETEIGDYVLFAKRNSLEEKYEKYLFSSDEFFSYSQKLNEYNKWTAHFWQDFIGFQITVPSPEYFGFTSNALNACIKAFQRKNEDYDSRYGYNAEKESYKLCIYCNSAFFDGSLRAIDVTEIAKMDFSGYAGDNNRVTKMVFDPLQAVNENPTMSESGRYKMSVTLCRLTGQYIYWENRSIWDTLYDYAVHPEKVFEDGVTVEGVYCFSADYKERFRSTSYDNAHDCAIYYVTDRGDYVLYTSNTNEENGQLGALYLFPSQVFFDYATELGEHAAREYATGASEYTRPSPEEFGFTSYVFSPVEETPDPETPKGNEEPQGILYALVPFAIVGGIALLGIGTFAFIKKKRKK